MRKLLKSGRLMKITTIYDEFNLKPYEMENNTTYYSDSLKCVFVSL